MLIATCRSNSIWPETVANMMTENELNMLAAYMVDTHGFKALQYADSAVSELEMIGKTLRADA